MSNNFYNHGAVPATGASLSSATMRAEFDAIGAGFDKVSPLTGNADKVVVVNSGATAQTAIAKSVLIDTTVTAAADKATPADADVLPLMDSAASNFLKKLTWANLKATIKTYLSSVAFPIGSTIPSTGAFTTLSATGTVSTTGSGVQTLLASSSGSDAVVRLTNTTVSTGHDWYLTSGSNGSCQLVDNTAGTTRAYWDTSGNLGLSVPPSAWVGYNALQLPTSGFIGSKGDGLNLVANLYYSGGYKVVTTGNVSATNFSMGSGGFVWSSLGPPAEHVAGDPAALSTLMTLDANGNLLVGQTAQIGSEKVGVTQSANGYCQYLTATNAAYTSTMQVLNTPNKTASATFTFVGYYASSAVQFTVNGNGTIFSNFLTGGATTLSCDASGNIIRTPSDAKLKTNIRPLTYGLDAVQALRPVLHGWTEESNMGSGDTIGLIAQDAEGVVPELVSSGGDYKSLDYAKLSVVLVKAMQEQQALIEALTSRLTALEAANA